MTDQWRRRRGPGFFECVNPKNILASIFTFFFFCQNKGLDPPLQTAIREFLTVQILCWWLVNGEISQSRSKISTFGALGRKTNYPQINRVFVRPYKINNSSRKGGDWNSTKNSFSLTNFRPRAASSAKRYEHVWRQKKERKGTLFKCLIF